MQKWGLGPELQEKIPAKSLTLKSALISKAWQTMAHERLGGDKGWT